jgi:hypothetical protein
MARVVMSPASSSANSESQTVHLASVRPDGRARKDARFFSIRTIAGDIP